MCSISELQLIDIIYHLLKNTLFVIHLGSDDLHISTLKADSDTNENNETNGKFIDFVDMISNILIYW